MRSFFILAWGWLTANVPRIIQACVLVLLGVFLLVNLVWSNTVMLGIIAVLALVFLIAGLVGVYLRKREFEKFVRDTGKERLKTSDDDFDEIDMELMTAKEIKALKKMGAIGLDPREIAFINRKRRMYSFEYLIRSILIVIVVLIIVTHIMN